VGILVECHHGGICELSFLALFRETYKPRILQKKAGHLRKNNGDSNLHSKYDNDPLVTGSYVFQRAFVRLLKMPAQSPMVMLFAIYVSVVDGFLYPLLTTITEVFEATYGFSQGAAGLSYLGLSAYLFIHHPPIPYFRRQVKELTLHRPGHGDWRSPLRCDVRLVPQKATGPSWGDET